MHSNTLTSPLFPKLINKERLLNEKLQNGNSVMTALAVGLATWIFSFFLYCIPLWMIVIGSHDETCRLEDFVKMCANPLDRNLAEPILYYRPFTPALAWTLGLRGLSGLFLQYSAVPAMLACVFYALRLRTSGILALYATTGIALSYTVIWTNVHPGFPDSITNLFAAILLLTNRPIATTLLTVCAMLNDERFVLAIPALLLWHADLSSIKSTLISCFKNTLPFLVGLTLVMGVRYGLSEGIIGEKFEMLGTYRTIMDPAGSGAQLGFHYFAGIFMGWRFLWFAPVLYLTSKIDRENWLALSIFVFALLAIIFLPFLVADVSRSVGFGFTALLFSFWRLHLSDSKGLHQWLRLAVFLMIFTPCFYFMGDNLQLERPFPLSLIRALTGWDIVQLLR